MNVNDKFYRDLGEASGRHHGLCQAFDMVGTMGRQMSLPINNILDIQRALLEAAMQIEYPTAPDCREKQA